MLQGRRMEMRICFRWINPRNKSNRQAVLQIRVQPSSNSCFKTLTFVWNVRSLTQSTFASAYVRDAFKLLRECVKPALIVDGGQEGPGALGLAT